MIDKQTILTIKSKMTLEEVASRYLTVVCRNNTCRALCPFHDDHQPSLTIDPHRNTYKCYVCLAAGDVITFVQEVERLSFQEAVAMLAQQAGVQIAMEDRSHKSDLYDICEEVCQRYQVSLPVKAREYLHSRGIVDETIERFRIGFCRRGCLNGIDPKMLEEVGVMTEGHECLPNRLIFPIRDWLGRPIGFGGRIGSKLEEQHKAEGTSYAKYINTRTTELFQKDRTLYGADTARTLRGDLYLVEGYMDVLALYQQGVGSVASMGVAITQRHIPLLRRFNRPIYMTLDGDKGGQDGAERAARVFITSSLECSIKCIDGDPDECDVKAVPAMSCLDFLVNRMKQRNGTDPDGTMRSCVDFASLLSSVPDQADLGIKMDQMIDSFSRQMGVDKKKVRRIVKVQDVSSDQAVVRYDPLDLDMARLCVNAPEWAAFEYTPTDPKLSPMITRTLRYTSGGEVPTIDDIVEESDRSIAFGLIENQSDEYWQDKSHDIQEVCRYRQFLERFNSLRAELKTGVRPKDEVMGDIEQLLKSQEVV